MKKSFAKKLIIASMTGILLSSTVLTACGGDDYTAEDLQDARARKARGEKLNREDSNMVEGFEKWKAKKDKYADY
ncbi:hypothetical protein [Enterocloster alcoholdehydrogenati]|uniref:hypothetical protein n=1 Tax=Enterocloster alcoholdehydrogenati TaxID=2547410 RepID=UPI0015945BA4|nr:hypothetical protein [Enterocloster alcoholdehydrogenati]